MDLQTGLFFENFSKKIKKPSKYIVNVSLYIREQAHRLWVNHLLNGSLPDEAGRYDARNKGYYAFGNAEFPSSKQQAVTMATAGLRHKCRGEGRFWRRAGIS